MDLLARFVGISIVFAIYIAVGVEGAALTEACTVDGDCTETNNVCSSSVCACSGSSFQVDSSTTCTTKIALGEACTASPAGQCVDTNAECSSLTCACKAAHYIDNAGACQSQITFEQTCVSTVTATDQCAVTNQACSLHTDNTYKCLCTSAYYSDGSSSCLARKKPEETGCAADECVTHATCDTSVSPTICNCDAGYTATPTTTPTMCSGVVKFASLSYMYVVPILVSMMFLLR